MRMRITLIENFRAVFYAPFYAAIALKAYADEGLEVDLKLSSDAAHTAQSLIAGHGDVSWGGPLRLMIALEKNPAGAALAFCEAIGRDPFFLLAREPNPAFKPGDLAGKRLAVVTEVPTPWMCLQHDLALAGVDVRQITVIPGRSMTGNVAALRSGEADVIQVFQPFGAALVHERAAHVWYAAASRGLRVLYHPQYDARVRGPATRRAPQDVPRDVPHARLDRGARSAGAGGAARVLAARCAAAHPDRVVPGLQIPRVMEPLADPGACRVRLAARRRARHRDPQPEDNVRRVRGYAPRGGRGEGEAAPYIPKCVIGDS